ncbi:hypothetical protein DL769_007767 [Monosporascus sp. CRB-8-3]|nr:hypothetical protein DL769_007767 [Monosporascus sp. CRB-8-3]
MKFAKIVNLLEHCLFFALPAVLTIPAKVDYSDLELRQDSTDVPCTDDDVAGPPKKRTLGNQTSIDTSIQKRALDDWCNLDNQAVLPSSTRWRGPVSHFKELL